MGRGGAQLYVYYRVQPADLPALIAAVHALQSDLQAVLPGVVCTLSQRAEPGDGPLTLMETYAHPRGVGADWQQEIERSARERLAAWSVGERHVEVFVPCA